MQAGGVWPETAASLFIVARTTGEPLAATNTIQQAISRINRAVPLANMESMEHRLAFTLANRRVVWQCPVTRICI